MADPGDSRAGAGGDDERRIGDDERQRAVDALRAHTGAGRLTLDEFSDLAGRVFAARTAGELAAVRDSLPPGLDLPERVAPQPATPSPTADERAPRRRSRRFVGVMCGGGARGRWRPGRNVRAFAFWGSVHLDFRYAEFDGPVDVTATAVMGGVTIVVAEGTRVDLDGMVLMGGATNATRNVEPEDGAPVIAVHARGLWGGVTVVSRKTRAQRAAAEAEGGGTGARDRSDRRPSPRALGRGAPGLVDLSAKALHDIAVTMPTVAAAAGVRSSRRHRSRRSRRPSDPSWPPGAPGPPGPHGEPSWPPGVPRPPSPPRDPAADVEDEAGDDDERRAADPATGPSGTLTMMVTDIAGSTALAERLGDRRWTEVLGRHYALVRAEVARHGGTEIKAQGDGFLVVFPSARRAILAAVAVQRALAPVDREAHAATEAQAASDAPDPGQDGGGDVPLAVRIGLHTGEIVDVDGDVLGQNVVVAVRIADQARPGDVVVSGLTRDLTVSSGDIAFDQGCEVELKGLSQPWRVHRVDWQRAEG